MKKIISILLVLAMVMVMAFTGCASKETPATPATPAPAAAAPAAPAAPAKTADPIVLKYGHIWAADTRMDKAVQMVASLVKERSGGRLIIENYPGSQLGAQMDEMENVKQGTQDITMVYGIDRYCPDFTLFNTPLYFP